MANTSERLTILLRSRQVRVLLTCCCLLVIGGWVMLNLQTTPRRALTQAELAELELTEFEDEPESAFAAPDESDPASRRLDDSANPVDPAVAPGRSRDSGVISAGFVDPSATAGPRGAWLTGQIESN